jgi:hypothetical protein
MPLGQVMVAIRRAIASGSLPAPMIDSPAHAWISRHLRAGDYIRATGRSPRNTTRDLRRAVDDGWLRSAASDELGSTSWDPC